MRIRGQEVDVRRVTEGFGADAEVPHAAALAEFAEAVVLRDTARTAAVRATLREALGAVGLVDAAATVAAFHGFVRLADAIGIPYTTAARGQDVPELREQAGINAFYRVLARD
jgi:alkylhydroperoxidase family enzyme